MAKKMYDFIVIGGGASGVFCAGKLSSIGKSVLILDNGKSLLRKVRASGGGRCNFTNLNASKDYYFSQNPNFCISALKNFTPRDFISLVEEAGVEFHEKHLGQQFCDSGSQKIIDFLIGRLDKNFVDISLETCVSGAVKNAAGQFVVSSDKGEFIGAQLVVATGGVSFPSLGATDIGLVIAENFGHKIIPFKPALVGFQSTKKDLADFIELAGIAVPGVAIKVGRRVFKDSILFTHKGLSGPAAMQASLFYNQNDTLIIDFLPEIDLIADLLNAKRFTPKLTVDKLLNNYLPKKLAAKFIAICGIKSEFGNCPDKQLVMLGELVNSFKYAPVGTLSFDTAEVSRGGVDTTEVSSQNMESKLVGGLYFIGEVLDVAGCLGGYNLQWCWSSGFSLF